MAGFGPNIPRSSFVSTKVIANQVPIRATIEGDLTLHGVTRPLTLKARFVGASVDPITKGYTVGFDGEGVLKTHGIRRDWDLAPR